MDLLRLNFELVVHTRRLAQPDLVLLALVLRLVYQLLKHVRLYLLLQRLALLNCLHGAQKRGRWHRHLS